MVMVLRSEEDGGEEILRTGMLKLWGLEAL